VDEAKPAARHFIPPVSIAMQSLQITLFGQNDPEVHDYQCTDDCANAAILGETPHQASAHRRLGIAAGIHDNDISGLAHLQSLQTLDTTIGGDQQGVPLVATSDQLEQHTGFRLILASVDAQNDKSDSYSFVDVLEIAFYEPLQIVDRI